MPVIVRSGLIFAVALALALVFWMASTSDGAAFPQEPHIRSTADADAEFGGPSKQRGGGINRTDVTDRKGMATATPAPAPGLPNCSGRVLLLDGEPVPDCRIVAVRADCSPSVANLEHDWAKVPGVLASTITKSGGEFELIIDPHRSPQSDPFFRIFHLSANAIPQLDVVYRLSAAQDIEHRLAGGRIVIQAVLSDGAPVQKAIVWLHPNSSTGDLEAGSTAFTSNKGECGFVMASPTRFDVTAYHGTLQSGALATDGYFEPGKPCVVRLELKPMDRGAIRVRIVDQNNQPVPRFAVRVRWHGELVRHVAAEDTMGEALITGLPEVKVSVDIDRYYTNAPTMYSLPKRPDRRWVTPDPSATNEIVFRLTTYARLQFEVDDGARDRQGGIAVFVRNEHLGPQGDWRQVGVEQYKVDGSSASTAIQGPGTWFTEPLEPGAIEVQVRAERSGDVLYAGWAQLIAGRATTCPLGPLKNK